MSAWTADQLRLALALYCQLPFGRMHSRNPEIIHLAQNLGRTPSAVAMKLVNFASLDPQINNSGRKGLGNASALDRQVWNDFQRNWEKEIVPASRQLPAVEQQEPLAPTDGGTTRLASIEIRTRRQSFRRIVRAATPSAAALRVCPNATIGGKSHSPWSRSRKHRLNPSNGLCLSSLHDKAFDCGLITVLPDFTVCVSAELKSKDGEPFARNALIASDGEKIRMPEKFAPSREFLSWHNENIFLG